MCGIFGFSGPRAVDESCLRFLAFLNQSRGQQSTGVFGNHTYKADTKAEEFIKRPGFKSAIKGAKAVGGHTRQASPGSAVTAENAHPFRFSSPEGNKIIDPFTVVGAHNGFIPDEVVKKHTKDLGFTEDFKVDSMLIFAAMNKHKDFAIISKIEGAMALWWMLPETDKDTIYLYKRFDTRPLAIGQRNDGLYFSSLKEHLSLVGCHSVHEVDSNVIYTLRKGEIIDISSIADPVVKSTRANITRAEWRAGANHADLVALGIFAPTRSAVPATRNFPAVNKQAAMFKSEEDVNRSKLSSTHKIAGVYAAQNLKNVDDVQSAYKMLIANIREELKEYSAPIPVSPYNLKSYDQESFIGCVVHFKLLNEDNNLPLQAWAILADTKDQYDGITSINGIGMIKFPPGFNNQQVKFQAYSPIDGIGPFDFYVTLTRGKVMEVTLRIPFRKEDKERLTQIGNQRANDNKSNEPSGTNNTVHISNSGARSTEGTTSDNTTVVQDGQKQIHMRYEKAKVAGQIPAFIELSGFISDAPTSELQSRIQKTIATRSIHNSDIGRVVELGVGGHYTMFFTPTDAINRFCINHPGVIVYINLYASKFDLSDFKYVTLVNDAVRCMGYDRQKFGVWAEDVGVYIDKLLAFQAFRYVHKNSYSYTTTHTSDDTLTTFVVDEKFKAETLKKRDYSVEGYLAATVVPYNFQAHSAFFQNLLWILFKPQLLEDSKPTVKLLQSFTDSAGDLEKALQDIIVGLTGAIQETEAGVYASHNLRLAAIKARDFLRGQKEEVEFVRNKSFNKLLNAKMKSEAVTE